MDRRSGVIGVFMFEKRWKKMEIFVAALSVGTVMTSHAIYQVGDQGSEVKKIQSALNAKGFKTNTNGKFTLETKKAVIEFQRRYKLDQDGVVGPATYVKLTGQNLGARSTDISLKKGSKKGTISTVDDTFRTEELEPFDDSLNENSSPVAKKLLDVAVQYRGVPYQFGGTTPKGFDCSGYLRYVFQQALDMDLPRSADEQYLIGKSINYSKLAPGDLVFFETYTKGVSHSGIYVGKGKFISATSSKGVIEADLTKGYWREHYVGAKRVLK